MPTAPERTRLRNVASGLCLDTRDEPRDGSGTRLADCCSAWTQQWAYEDDGLLRSVADPGLCLDSRKGAGAVVLGACADPGGQRATCGTTPPCRASWSPLGRPADPHSGGP
ncbi:ricin-type beta-trefoil lectin domain protein [Streptomyces pimonensis]|uniref:ricin-type beta-trefoil lectin domain protein n=1 Tax=Streptomyces pimonensis TaxID=2860288 RepID=UPI003528B439